MTIDDPDFIARRIAYMDHIRGMHRKLRTVGMIGCLIGVVVMAWGRFTLDAPSWAVWAGLSVVAVSWLAFAYVIFSRTKYVRAHPFDPKA